MCISKKPQANSPVDKVHQVVYNIICTILIIIFFVGYYLFTSAGNQTKNFIMIINKIISFAHYHSTLDAPSRENFPL